MGRAFPFTYQGRALRLSPITVDEGWELWVLEGNRKVVCAARVSIDEALECARKGEDLISALAEQTKVRILSADLNLPSADTQPR